MAVVQSVFKVLMVTVAGMGVVALSSPAQAGFEWTPPAKAEVATQAPAANAPAQTAPADPNLLTPEPGDAAPVAPVEGAALQSGDLAVPAEEPPVQTEGPALKTLTPSHPAQPVAEAPQAVSPAPSAAPTRQSYPPRKREGISWTESAPKEVKKEQSSPAPAAEVAAPAPTAPADSPILDAAPVQGFGKDIPLAIALRQIAPPSYAYKFDDGVSAGQKVSWEGGKPWPQVLSDMLTASNLQVVIQGNVITVQKVGSSIPSGAPAAEQGASTPNEEVAPPQEAAQSAVPVEEPKTETKIARLSDMGKPAETEADDLPVPVTEPVANAAQNAEEAEIKAAATEDKPIAAVAGDNAPVVDIQSKRRWQANPGKTLRETLEAWSQTAGAEIEWMSPYDYPVEHAFVFEGRFDEAVDSLLSLYSREQSRPRGRLYPNLPSGPSVLMIN